MSNGSGLLEQLATVSGATVQGAQVLAAMDQGINLVAKLVPPLGTAVGLVEGILNVLDPSANSPTIADVQNQIAQFAATVEQELTQLQATVAAGQVKESAEALETLLTGPDGPLTIAGEIPTWKNSPGLPLPANFPPGPGQLQIFARSPILTLLGGGPGAAPPDTRPTAYWWLPVGDLPLFKPPNPWTYAGATLMFNQPDELSAEGYPDVADANAFTLITPDAGMAASFDLSMFKFTNDFSPTQVAGIPGANAFNPTWVLQQSMAAVYYYLLICGAVLENFPNDGSTIPDFVGDNNFAGNLSWYHDQIRAGIVNIRPPFYSDLIPINSDGVTISASADAGVSQWNAPCAAGYVGAPTFSAASAPASPWKRPFGALCNYNGYVAGAGGSQPSVDQYPNYVYPAVGQLVGGGPNAPLSPILNNPGHAWLNAFYAKYLIASLWRAKLVYLGMGLKDMWTTVNNLYVMCGKPPQPGPCFGDWSLKEVFQMLGSASIAPTYFAQSTSTVAVSDPAFPLPAQLIPVPETPIGSLTGGTLPPPAPTYFSTPLTVRALLQFINTAAPPPSKPFTSLRAALQA
jgi:hypothetical protein